jgi:hypothetical protein
MRRARVWALAVVVLMGLAFALGTARPAVPFVIAISMARARNEPVSSAVLLTLVLG